MRNPICRFFGCRAEYVDDPCVRCGDPVGYADMVGDTPFGRMKDMITEPWRRLRYMFSKDDDIPF